MVGALIALSAVSTGCTAVTAAQGGLSTAGTAVSTTKSTADTGKALGGDIKDGYDKVTGKKFEGGAAGDDKKEDEDGKRLEAKKTALNQPVNDELSLPKNDIMDWKAYDLSSIPAHTWVQFELNWDERESEILLDIYDQVGAQVVQSPGRAGTAQKKIPLKVETPGVYYARLTMVGDYPKKESVYTVLLRTRPGVALVKPTSIKGKKGGEDAAAR